MASSILRCEGWGSYLKALITNAEQHAVDTPQDLNRVISKLRKENND